MKALLVGGAGPTGVYLVEGLLERGFDVTVLHRGVHEPEELPPVEHLHADPHFAESFESAIYGRTFDLVVSTYGRIRLQAEIMAGRCDRFIGIGGITVYLGNAEPNRVRPHGMRVMADEDSPLGDSVAGPATRASKFVQAMIDTERVVFDLDARGAFVATWFRYPVIYGPRNPIPWEWSILKRVQDGRRVVILPDGGLSIRSRSFAANAAHAVLLGIDNPRASAGEVFNVAEDYQVTLRQWVETLNDVVGGQLEVVSLPWRIAKPGLVFMSFQGTGSPHVSVDATKAKRLLGYRDVIGLIDALRVSAGWYARHPVTAEAYPNFPDRFDYAVEDALIAVYERAIETVVSEVPFAKQEVVHNYPHPVSPSVGRDHRGR